MASDAFQNYAISLGIKEQGHFRTQPLSAAWGFEDVIGYYPPILYHLTSIVSATFGVEVYDGLMLLVILLLLTISLTFYLIIRRYNKNIALFSLPLMLLVFQNKFSSSITWGQHGVIIGIFFMMAFLFAAIKFEFENIFLTVIFLCASFYSHVPEFVFSMVFILVFMIFKILYKQFKLVYLKRLLIIGIISLAINFYYFTILQSTWLKIEGFEVTTLKEFLEGRAYPAIFLLKDFNLFFSISIIIGAAIAIFVIIKKQNMPLLAALFLFSLGYSNYIFGLRAFQQRFLWPIYLSIFFGLGIYCILKTVIKKWKKEYSLALFLFITSFILFSGKPAAGSLMDPYHWNSFKWIRDNTDKHDPFYFFYQDIIWQPAIYYASSQRKSYSLDMDEFIGTLQASKSIERHYRFRAAAEGGGGGFPYRKSLFSYGYYMDKKVIPELKNKIDICNMKYLVFDKISKQTELAKYNILLINELLKNEWIKVAYSNEIVVILKNNKVGVDCIVSHKITG